MSCTKIDCGININVKSNVNVNHAILVNREVEREPSKLHSEIFLD